VPHWLEGRTAQWPHNAPLIHHRAAAPRTERRSKRALGAASPARPSRTATERAVTQLWGGWLCARVVAVRCMRRRARERDGRLPRPTPHRLSVLRCSGDFCFVCCASVSQQRDGASVQQLVRVGCETARAHNHHTIRQFFEKSAKVPALSAVGAELAPASAAASVAPAPVVVLCTHRLRPVCVQLYVVEYWRRRGLRCHQLAHTLT
jgi:hypothetical protein